MKEIEFKHGTNYVIFKDTKMVVTDDTKIYKGNLSENQSYCGTLKEIKNRTSTGTNVILDKNGNILDKNSTYYGEVPDTRDITEATQLGMTHTNPSDGNSFTSAPSGQVVTPMEIDDRRVPQQASDVSHRTAVTMTSSNDTNAVRTPSSRTESAL